jgi:hypothetical protein
MNLSSESLNDRDSGVNLLAAIAVNLLIIFGPLLLGIWVKPPPKACFATEESYDPLYTFELFL